LSDYGGVIQKLCLCLFTARGARSESSQANAYAYTHIYLYFDTHVITGGLHAGLRLQSNIATHS